MILQTEGRRIRVRVAWYRGPRGWVVFLYARPWWPREVSFPLVWPRAFLALRDAIRDRAGREVPAVPTTEAQQVAGGTEPAITS